MLHFVGNLKDRLSHYEALLITDHSYVSVRSKYTSVNFSLRHIIQIKSEEEIKCVFDDN